MNADNSLVDRLEILIGKRTQKDFAAWLDVSPQSITSYFKAGNHPAWSFLQKLAQKGVNINWFLTGQGSPYLNINLINTRIAGK
jgi:hypothetical protein